MTASARPACPKPAQLYACRVVGSHRRGEQRAQDLSVHRRRRWSSLALHSVSRSGDGLRGSAQRARRERHDRQDQERCRDDRKAEERRSHGRQACGQCRDVGSGQERHPAQGRFQVRAASGRPPRTRRAAGLAWPERSARSERARARQNASTSSSSANSKSVVATCPSGKRVIGGGAQATGTEPTRCPSTRTSRIRLATSGTRRPSRSCRPGSLGSFSRTHCARM